MNTQEIHELYLLKKDETFEDNYSKQLRINNDLVESIYAKCHDISAGKIIELIESFNSTNLSREKLLSLCSQESNVYFSICREIDSYCCENTTIVDRQRLMDCLLLGVAYLELYCQLNYTGPELSPTIVERFCPNETVHKSSLQHLECDGFYPFSIILLPQTLLIARSILCYIADPVRACWKDGITLDAEGKINKTSVTNPLSDPIKQCKLISTSWWNHRALMMHLRLLQKQSYEHIPTLWQECQDMSRVILNQFCNIDITSNIIKNEYKLVENKNDNSIYDYISLLPEADQMQLLALAWLEWGLSLHHFEYGDKGKKAFDYAKDAAKLQTNLTASLGKRTKYQHTDYAQLYVYAESTLVKMIPNYIDQHQSNNSNNSNKNAVSSDNNNLKTKNVSDSVVADTSEATTEASNNNSSGWQHSEWELGRRLVREANNNTGEEAAVREVMLDSMDGGAVENILLEGGPQFTRTEGNQPLNKGGILHPIDQAIVLALCIDVSNSNPEDGLTNEEMAPYIERVLDLANNWMIHSTALLQRSWLEFERRKTADRAMLQIQALIDQHSTKLTITQSTYKSIEESAPAKDRLRYLYSIVYASQHELKRDLAMKYLRCQVFMSALNYFKELELWDEVVTCYQLLQKPHRAELVVREQLKINETPYMVCSLADLTGKEELYEKAWQLSKGRYARAKRTWAKICYDRGDFTACISHMNQALTVQPLVATAWYLKGIACMRLERWEEGVQAFVRCVQQDMEIGEAWTNIGAIYMKTKQWNKAYSALIEAIKIRTNCHKVLENMIIICIHLGKWKEVIHYMNRILDLNINGGEKLILIDELQRLCYIVSIMTKKEFVMNMKDKEKQQQQTEGLNNQITNMNNGTNSTNNSKSNNNIPNILFPQLSQTPDEDDEINELHTIEELPELARNTEKLMDRVVNAVKSTPEVWNMLAEFQHTLGRFTLELDARTKQFRALIQEPNWEKFSDKIETVVNTAIKLCDAHKYKITTKKDLYGYRMLLQSTVRKIESIKENKEEQSIATLKDLITKVESCMNSL